MKVYGPYLTSDKKRRIVILIGDDGSRKTTAYARYLMEQHLGRELADDETVDHIDEDPLNDDLSNLQVLPALDNVIRPSANQYTVQAHVAESGPGDRLKSDAA